MKTKYLAVSVSLMLAFMVFLPQAEAVVPPPDGGYPGGNTAEGQNALLSLTSGGFNAAVGWLSLRSLTMGNFNTGIGAGTLALDIADENTATGTGALLFNTTGFQNTASGAFALFNNGIGNFNTAIGFQALFSNTEGLSNTAIGVQALQNNTTGSVNTAIGIGALISNTIGSGNIALGNGAGFNVTTGNFNIAIGNFGFADDSQTIRIGADQTKTFIAGIRGITTGNNNAVSVVIDSAGQLGTMSSSRRFKKEIKPMDKASEAILALKPVTFHYKSDKTNTPHFGLIAEEVAEVDPDLVVRDDNGEIYTVRYDQVNAMLLNEFRKEHRAFVEEQLKVAEQQKEIDALKEELKEQRYLIQKVSDRIELKRSAPQTVANNP